MPVVNGGPGNDTLPGTTGDDAVSGLGGNDRIYASSGTDSIDGGTGNDRVLITPGNPALFAPGAPSQSYTITSTSLTSASGTLNTSMASIEFVELIDLRDGNVTVNASGFTSSVGPPWLTLALGNGNHNVTGTGGPDRISLGIGSSVVNTNSPVENGLNQVILSIGGSATDLARVTSSGGATVVSYVSGGVAQQTTITGPNRLILQSGDYGLFADATNAPESASLGFITTPSGPVPISSNFGVWFVDSMVDDVVIGSRYTDELSSAGNGSGTVNGGTDTLVGNGGRDFYDYELALENFRGDHFLDFDADDQLMTSYYGDQEPVFRGRSAFTGTAREIRYETYDGKTVVSADYDGDGFADGSVVIESGEFELEGFDLYGGAGNATIRIATSQTMVYGTSAGETLNGTTGADVLRGYDGNDALLGGNAADVLDGGRGADQMTGGLGDDHYLVDDASDAVTELAGGGTDTVISLIGYTLGNELERLTLAGVLGINGTGNPLANAIYGNGAVNALNGLDGADRLFGLGGGDSLDGGTGADRMEGGADNDIYTVDNAGDRAIENANEGTDLVNASVSFELGANVENLTLTDIANTSGAGNALANLLIGNSGNNWLVGLAGNDTLDGRLGADRMEGGADNDTYVVDNTGDRVIEGANAGTDLVQAWIGFELTANVEDLTLLGGSNTAGGGNVLANTLTGNAGNNWLVGLGGNDILDGGTGGDRMEGGADNDTYYVDNTGDRVLENANSGTDRVVSSITFELGANVENLTLTGNGNTSGAGNALANMLTGNAGNNWLVSLAGNDTLDGGLGSDRMEGGADNDTYYVDNVNDRATEKANEGTDRVIAAITFELGANVENLTLTGSGNTSGAGNVLANVLTGNSGNNWLVALAGNDVLDGGTGADKMEGGADNDIYLVDNTGDRVIEKVNEGVDMVQASISFELGTNVENLTLTGSGNTSGGGNALANVLTGNTGENWLVGLAGNDVLDGGLAADRLDGGADQDVFAFTTALGGGNIDRITGFVAADDTIRLENAVFTGLAAGALAAGAYNTGASATQADDRIIYDANTGALWFDADGVGGAAGVQFATLSAGLSFTSADFLVI